MAESDEPRMLEGLDDLRAELDEIDHGILQALIARDRVVAEVARRKSRQGDSKVRDPVREEAQLARLTAEGQAAGLDGFYVGRVFRELLDHSVRFQQEFLARLVDGTRATPRELVVAYQGIDGAYSHLAAMRHFGPRGGSVVFRGYPSFRAMMEAVRDGLAHYGVLPIENTTAGSINDAYDLLAQMDLSIVGEELQRVDHCLVAIEPVPLHKLRRVFSHPQALAQCSNFLSSLTDCHIEAFADTAMAVQRVGQEQDLAQAAIASEDAARRYGLTVIRRDIANQKENYTRMVVVAARPEKVDLRVAAKTSMVLALKHEQGALLGCLSALAERGLNLTKLESRPRLHTPWEYLFYLDFEGNIDDPAVQEALAELRAQTSFLRVLGSYPARRASEGRALGTARAPRSPGERAPAAAATNPTVANAGAHADGLAAVDASAAAGNPAGGGSAAASASSAATSGSSGVANATGTPSRASGAARPAFAGAAASARRPSSREFRSEDTVIALGRAMIGGKRPVFLARVSERGERGSLLDVARALAKAGADALHVDDPGALLGGTRAPYGEEALHQLEEIAKLTGLALALDVNDPQQVERAARRADLLVVPALHMQNDALLRELGRLDRPVMLERSSMASIDEWLEAADRVLARGNHRVALCERGIRTFESATLSTLDLGALPVLRERSHLPVIVDPSRATGRARWTIALAEGARAAGAHGLALSVLDVENDGEALGLAQFAELVARLSAASPAPR